MTKSDYFQNRIQIGKYVKDLLEQRGISKSNFCNEIDISRPTLDKVLSGTIPNVNTYEKYINKIFSSLGVTFDNLCNTLRSEIPNLIHQISDQEYVSLEKLSVMLNIDLQKLKNHPEDLTSAEFTDIAIILGTSALSLQGKGSFPPQVSLDDVLIKECKNIYEGASGICCYIEFNIIGFEMGFVYPISGSVLRNFISENNNDFYWILPCFNNKLLLLNKTNIKSFRLIDKDNDELIDIRDNPLLNGTIPDEFYYVIDDYDFLDDADYKDRYSDKTREYVRGIVKEFGLDSKDINMLTDQVNIFYSDGSQDSILSGYIDELADDIDSIHNFNLSEGVNHKFSFSDIYGSSYTILGRNICLMEIPLAKIEKSLQRLIDECEE